jgi:hypothetical protein
MRPEPHAFEALAETFEHIYDTAGAHHQRLAEGGESFAQFHERLADERPVPRRAVRRFEDARLDDVERQHRPAASGLGERAVVGHAEVALEPDDLDRDAGSGRNAHRRRSTT